MLNGLFSSKEEPEQTAKERADAEVQYRRLTQTLEHSIRWLRWVALVVFVIGFLGGGAAVIYLPTVTNSAAVLIKDNPGNALLAIFEMVRTTAYAGLVGTFLFGVLTLGRACLDQATRYQKRLMAALFMQYTLDQYGRQIRKSDINLNDVVKFMDAWSKNVESAFTKVKFGGKNAPALNLEYEPKTGRIRVGSGDSLPPNSTKDK